MKRLAMLSILAVFSIASVCRCDELKVGETCFHGDGSSTIQFGDTRFHLNGTTRTLTGGTEFPCDDLNSVANGEALVDKEKTRRAESLFDSALRGHMGTIAVARIGVSRVENFSMGRVCRKLIQMAAEMAVWIV